MVPDKPTSGVSCPLRFSRWHWRRTRWEGWPSLRSLHGQRPEGAERFASRSWCSWRSPPTGEEAWRPLRWGCRCWCESRELQRGRRRPRPSRRSALAEKDDSRPRKGLRCKCQPWGCGGQDQESFPASMPFPVINKNVQLSRIRVIFRFKKLMRDGMYSVDGSHLCNHRKMIENNLLLIIIVIYIESDNIKRLPSKIL